MNLGELNTLKVSSCPYVVYQEIEEGTSGMCHHLLLKTSATSEMQADLLVDIESGNIGSDAVLE